jgi:hypothetical protein
VVSSPLLIEETEDLSRHAEGVDSVMDLVALKWTTLKGARGGIIKRATGLRDSKKVVINVSKDTPISVKPSLLVRISDPGITLTLSEMIVVKETLRVLERISTGAVIKMPNVDSRANSSEMISSLVVATEITIVETVSSFPKRKKLWSHKVLTRLILQDKVLQDRTEQINLVKKPFTMNNYDNKKLYLTIQLMNKVLI